jgi:hypothetical protein
MGQRIPTNGSSSWQISEQATSKGLTRHARIRRLVTPMGLEPMVSSISSPPTIVLANSKVAGAPECYRPDETSVRDKLRVGQNVDIWSLGCVYSEAARWVKSHYKGVVQYRNERKDEISKIAEFQDADCFHDGSKVLITVKESHIKSTTNLRTEDYITRAVVDRMITNMLDVAPARPTAANLWYISKGIVSDARNQLQLATFPSGERRASRSGLSRGRTVPEHTPPSPPVLPPRFSAPDSPDFDRLHQRGSSTPHRPERLSTPSRISSSHLLESPSPNGRGEQHGHSPDFIAEDSQWTSHSPGSGAQQRSVDIPRFAGRGDASARETTKRSSQHSVSTTPQAGMSGMGTSWESGSMSTMNGGYQRGARKRHSDNSESYSSSPILGQAGANRRSSSPDVIDRREFPPKSHSRYNSQRESSHSRVVSDNSDLSTMTSTGAHRSNTETFTAHPHSQHRPPPAPTQHTEQYSTPPVAPEHWSVEEALDWKRERKETGRHRPIPNPQLHDRLRKRDHVRHPPIAICLGHANFLNRSF